MNKDIYSNIVSFVKKNIKLAGPVFMFVVAAIVTFVALSARSRREIIPDPMVASEPVIDVSSDEVEIAEVPLALTENTDGALTDFIVEYYLCFSKI